MWKQIIELFRSGGPLQEAFDEAIVMLRSSRDMFNVSVKAVNEVRTNQP